MTLLKSHDHLAGELAEHHAAILTRPAAPRGHAAAGEHHGFPLARSVGTGELVAHSGAGWESVAVVVAAYRHTVTVRCPNGCRGHRPRLVGAHTHGRAGGNGEGSRMPHCHSLAQKVGYVVLDLDNLCAVVPVCRCDGVTCPNR